MSVFPLTGRTILVTRSKSQAGVFSTLLREAGATVLEVPTITIVPLDPEPLDQALRRLDAYDWVFFTSVNTVDIVMERYRQMQPIPFPRVCSIGPATSHRLRAQGVPVSLQPSVFQAEGIIEEFTTLHQGSLTGIRVLLPRARIAREILPLQLRERGAQVDVIPVYSAQVPEASRRELLRIFEAGPPDLVTFTSSSTVRHFLELAPDPDVVADLRCAVIGPITAETARENGLQVVCMPNEFTIPALVDAIIDHFAAEPAS